MAESSIVFTMDKWISIPRIIGPNFGVTTFGHIMEIHVYLYDMCSLTIYKARLHIYIYQAQNPRVAIWPLLKSQGKALLSVERRICQWEVVAQLFQSVLYQKYPSKWLKLMKNGQNRKITLFSRANFERASRAHFTSNHRDFWGTFSSSLV